MSPLDTAISNLSSDEIDTLNSDPKLLSDFKAKYVGASDNAGPSMMDMLKTGVPLPGILGHAQNTVEDIGQNIAGSAEAIKTGLYDLPKAAFTDSVNALKSGAANLAGVDSPSQPSELAHLTESGVDGMAQGVKSFADHPVDTMVKHPVSTALAIKGGIDLGSTLMPETPSQVGKFLEKAANIPSKATELEGFNEPTPTQDEINSSIQKVRDTVKNVWKEHGDLLNKARTNAGLPTTEDEVAASVRKYGNEFGIDLNKPLALPKELESTNVESQKPTLEADELRKKWVAAAVEQGDLDPDKALKYTRPDVFDPDHVPKAAHETMPFTIGDHDTPEQLMTEINRFKSNQQYIAPADRIKAAEYYKDQIVKQGVLKQDTAKGRTMGVLKSQFGDLSDVTTENASELKAAKTKMGDLYDTMDDISKKLSDGPGAAESYLRRLFTSKAASYKDDLKALAKIEQLSGKPVLTELFKKFAGESYGQTLGRSISSITQWPHALATSPKYTVTPLMKFGPGALRAPFVAAGGLGQSAIHSGFTPSQINPDNRSELQSLKDRLLNNNETER